MPSRSFLLAPLIAMALLHPTSAESLEKIKVATTFLGLWDTSQPAWCAQRGKFEKAGLDVEVITTRGGSENVQAVVAGGMDIGYSPGINSVLSAAMSGAPIKIISAEFLGQNDTYFYVPTASAIQGVGDLAGKSVAYSVPAMPSRPLCSPSGPKAAKISTPSRLVLWMPPTQWL